MEAAVAESEAEAAVAEAAEAIALRKLKGESQLSFTVSYSGDISKKIH